MRFETMADDIAELIRTLGLERASTMGFSLGGAVAPAGLTHYDINVAPALSAAVIPFLDGA